MLSPREEEVLSYLSQGASTKAIAYELGITTSTVHEYVTRARTKTGARSRTALIVPEDVDLPKILSPSERAIVRALLSGKTYKEIAASRGRSPSTIANLIARAFRKLGVSSKSELASRVRLTR